VHVEISELGDVPYRNCIHLYSSWDAGVLQYLLPADAEDPLWWAQLGYEMWRSYREEQQELDAVEQLAWDAYLEWRSRTWTATVACKVAAIYAVLVAFVSSATQRCATLLRRVRLLGPPKRPPAELFRP
jgi:hypothetical protein